MSGSVTMDMKTSYWERLSVYNTFLSNISTIRSVSVLLRVIRPLLRRQKKDCALYISFVRSYEGTPVC